MQIPVKKVMPRQEDVTVVGSDPGASKMFALIKWEMNDYFSKLKKV